MHGEKGKQLDYHLKSLIFVSGICNFKENQDKMGIWNAEHKPAREAVFAGKFYSSSKYELSQELFNLFEKAEKCREPGQKPRALIVPHAGYIFSGKVAASAYRQIPPGYTYNRIFIIASSHRYHYHGAAVYTQNYTTPLGEIKTDNTIAEKLMESSTLFRLFNEAHDEEHSLEVQLPFLQHCLNNHLVIVPVILGTNSPAECEKIAATLEPWFSDENLFVISTDFSHYPEYEDASRIDLLTAQSICRNDPDGLLSRLEENRKMDISNLATSLCGWTSVLTLNYLTRGKKIRYSVIDYQNSGDSLPYGDHKRVVGYWAIAVHNNNLPFDLSDDEKNELLEKAKSSVRYFLKNGSRKDIIPSASETLNKITGVFVSIYIKDSLRGCIGGFARDKTVNEMVQTMAVSAACDHRFEQISEEETIDMELEISVLSPLKKIKSISEIELGKHGIYIRKGLNSGTFLPQVALKTGWKLEEFLGHCSRDKAGLGWDEWKTADLYTYEAIVFRGK